MLSAYLLPVLLTAQILAFLWELTSPMQLIFCGPIISLEGASSHFVLFFHRVFVWSLLSTLIIEVGCALQWTLLDLCALADAISDQASLFRLQLRHQASAQRLLPLILSFTLPVLVWAVSDWSLAFLSHLWRISWFKTSQIVFQTYLHALFISLKIKFLL